MDNSNLDSVVRKVRQLLKLAERSSSPNEAALAATRAAELMVKYEIEQASLRLDTDVQRKAPEPIVKDHTVDGGHPGWRHGRLCFWKFTVLQGVAAQHGCKPYRHGANMHLFGRQSAVQTASYVWQYLCVEIERLSDEAWATVRDEYLAQQRAAFNSWTNAKSPQTHARAKAKQWLNSFRHAAASTVAHRLKEAAYAAKLAREAPPVPTGAVADAYARALVVVQHDADEVTSEYKLFTADWRGRSTGSNAAYVSDAHAAGRRAGSAMRIDNQARGGLGVGAPRLNGR